METTIAMRGPGERGEAELAAAASGLTPLTRLGVGGTGTGSPFHDHLHAFNFGFAGRKRWLVVSTRVALG